MNFLQRTPFFRLLLALISGIISARYLYCPDNILIIIASFVMCFILLSFLLYRNKNAYTQRWIFGASVFVFLYLTGFYLTAQNKYPDVQVVEKIKKTFTVEIVETPVIKAKTISAGILINRVDDSLFHYLINQKAVVNLMKDSAGMKLGRGDILMINTCFEKPPGNLNPDGFDYAAFLHRKGIHWVAFIGAGKWKKIGHHTGFSIKALAEKTRDQLLAVFGKYLSPGDEYAVLSALILGYQDDIDSELRESYSYSGTLHILAVSGLHVAVIYMILNAVLSLFLRSKYLIIIKILLIIFFLWTYSFVTGMSPSVIRSAVMFTLISIGTALDRKSQIYNTLSVSAFLILLFNPYYLFDLGFQLSYSAVISIVYFQPYIKAWYSPRYKPVRWWWDLTSVSLAAQIGTLPITLYYFNQFPNYFLLGNYVAIPLSTFIIYCAVCWMAVSFIGPLSALVAQLTGFLLKLLNVSVTFIHDLPHAISVFYISFWQMLFLLAALFMLVLMLEYRKFIAVFSFLMLILCFLSVDLYAEYRSYNQQKLVVYADRKNTHLDLIRGKKHFVFTEDSAAVKKVAGAYWRNLRLNISEIISDSVTTFSVFNQKKILFLKDDLLKKKHVSIPFTIDYLILGERVKIKPENLFACVNPKICIIDQTISPWYRDTIRHYCELKKLTFYDVAERGAFVLE